MFSHRGKWGVTRDSDGNLAFLTAWPWYWRYPCAIAIASAGLWFAIYMMPGASEWARLGVGGVALFFALAIAYELGCLVMVVAFFSIIWILSDALIPDFKLSVPAQIGIVAAGAFYAWHVGKNALDKSDAQQRQIDGTWQRVMSESERLEENVEALHERISKLEDRLRKLERDEDGFKFL